MLKFTILALILLLVIGQEYKPKKDLASKYKRLTIKHCSGCLENIENPNLRQWVFDDLKNYQNVNFEIDETAGKNR